MEAGIAVHVWERDAYGTATDRQAEAVKALSVVAAKDNRAAFRKALAHAEQTRQDA